MLLRINELLLLIFAIAIFVMTLELTFRVGFRHRKVDDDAGRAHIVALHAALLGLLALLLGFTFAMSVTRYEARKALVVEEANAVTRAYLRSQLMESPYREKFGQLLRDYAHARIRFHLTDADNQGLDAANADAVRLERQIWDTARSAAKQDVHSTAVTLLMIQSVNEMVDVNEKRHVALENHVPLPVHLLLFCVASGAMAFIGYGCGLNGKRRPISTAIFATMIALVLTFIVDIDRPRSGLIKVSQESMIRLQDTLDAATP